MEYASLIEVGERLCKAEIPEIEENTNFWMLRSKGGFFYDEFTSEGFIALGWNYITKATSMGENNIELLKEAITHWYGDKVPMTAINKCNKFINNIWEGDYVIIPNKGGAEIAICEVGEYYEEDYDASKEILAIKKIENKDFEIGQVKCPYRKRRKIKVVLKISTDRLSPHLLKAMSSYHGLSDLNSCALDILNCIYDCYVYKNSVMFSINVSKSKPIKAREMSKLMYGITEMFCSITDEDTIMITANINSPGKIVAFLKDGYDKLGKNACKILLLYVAIFGGSGFGFEFNGIVGSTVDIIKEIRTIDLDIDIKEEDLKGKRLENYLKTIEIIRVGEDANIDVTGAIKSLETMESLNESLQFKSNQEFAKKEIEK